MNLLCYTRTFQEVRIMKNRDAWDVAAATVVLALATLGMVSMLSGCAGVTIPPCIRYLAEGTLKDHPECIPPVSPSPSPSPQVSPSASPSPVVEPSPSPSPQPLPSPSPTPPTSSPSPSPLPSPSPTATPVPSDGNEVPPEGVCPESWPTVPSRMGLGERPLNVQRRYDKDTGSYWTAYILNTTPRAEPPFCPHRGNTGECEMWAPCAAKHNPDGRQSLYDGRGFVDEPVERRSNNQYLYVIIVSTNPSIGSDPGRYQVCAAPEKKDRGTPKETCRTYDMTDK